MKPTSVPRFFSFSEEDIKNKIRAGRRDKGEKEENAPVYTWPEGVELMEKAGVLVTGPRVFKGSGRGLKREPPLEEAIASLDLHRFLCICAHETVHCKERLRYIGKIHFECKAGSCGFQGLEEACCAETSPIRGRLKQGQTRA